MKINKSLITILIVVLNILAAAVAIPPVISGNEEYNELIGHARENYEMGLCEKAMVLYDQAMEIEDSLELRVEMADVYYAGIENGEFKSYYKFSNFLLEMVEAYYKEIVAYDTALEYLYEAKDYENCIAVIYQAEDLEIESETITNVRNEVKYICEVNYSTYDEVIYTSENTYLIENEKYRLLNQTLGSLTGEKYDYATPMLNGHALVKNEDYTMLINSDSVREAYFPKEITESTGVGDNLIACKINDSYAYYDLNGNELFGNYKFAGRFANGVAAVQTEQGWRIINIDGSDVIDKSFEDVKLSQTNDCSQSGIIFAKENGKYCMYDCDMNKISSIEFDDVDVFISKDDYAACEVNDVWGYVNSEGEIVIKPQYELAHSFANGLAGVKENDVWSFINTSNEVAIIGEFTDVNYFNNKGYCFVENETYWYYLRRLYVDD